MAVSGGPRAQWKSADGLAGQRSVLDLSGWSLVHTDLLRGYMEANRHVCRPRCVWAPYARQGQGGGRRRGWATHTLTTCLPLFAGSRVRGVNRRVKKVNSSWALLRETSKLIAAPTFCWRMLYLVLCWRRAERCPWCWVSGFVLREFTMN